MKRPNGSGGIRKLSGKRRHPYQVVVSAGHEIRNNKVCVKQASLGCYATKKEALEALAEWQVTHFRADMRQVTVKDVYDRISPDWSDSVKSSMQTVYNRYKVLENVRIANIKTYTIEDVPLPKLSKETHNIIRMFWHRIFMFGIENDIISKDYSEFIKFHETKEKQIKNALAPDEIKAVSSVRLYRILLYTGMRINELLAMETDQVYKEDGILCFHVLKSKTEAGKRIIPVHPMILNDIKLSGGYVITPKVSYNTVSREFKDFVDKNGLSQHTLHDFRRTFASYAKSCGMDDYYRKCLLGHVHGNVTDDVYTTAFTKDLYDQIKMLDYDL